MELIEVVGRLCDSRIKVYENRNGKLTVVHDNHYGDNDSRNVVGRLSKYNHYAVYQMRTRFAGNIGYLEIYVCK